MRVAIYTGSAVGANPVHAEAARLLATHLAQQGIGVVILSKNGEARLHYDSCLEIKADGKWEVHHELPGDAQGGHEDLRDLSC